VPTSQPLPKDQSSNDEGDALEALLTAARKAAAPAAGKSAGDAPLDALQLVADVGDGVMLLADLLAAGHSRAVVAALLKQGSDKRLRPRLALGVVGGHEVVWLRTAGWSILNYPNRREAAPTVRSLRHRLSGHNFEHAIEQRVAPIARQNDVLLEMVRGVPLRDYCKSRVGDAWTTIKTEGPEQTRDAGTVTGGVFPDVLVVENWPRKHILRAKPQGLVAATRSEREQLWPSVGGIRTDDADLAVAVEIELSGKAAPLLSAKVRQHDTAMRMGWWQVVVWVTDSTDVLTRLLRAGIGDPSQHPGHYVMGGSALGFGSDPEQPLRQFFPGTETLDPATVVPPPPWWLPHLGKRP
jgi:hypothetical protein